jgi:hypothetical protein
MLCPDRLRSSVTDEPEPGSAGDQPGRGIAGRRLTPIGPRAGRRRGSGQANWVKGSPEERMRSLIPPEWEEGAAAQPVAHVAVRELCYRQGPPVLAQRRIGSEPG